MPDERRCNVPQGHIHLHDRFLGRWFFLPYKTSQEYWFNHTNKRCLTPRSSFPHVAVLRALSQKWYNEWDQKSLGSETPGRRL